jgi:glycosyltransferase involved in cell wall biosynthesis
MYNLVKSSQLLNNQKTHIIPYGVNLNVYKPQNIIKSRDRLRVPKNNFNIFLKAGNNEYKVQKYIIETLNGLLDKKLAILNCDTKSQFDSFKNNFQIIDLGWINENILIHAYNSSNIFLMPSTAEAFGLMAIESMACGKPVITFQLTCIEDVINAPKCGITVPMKNSTAFKKAILLLMDNPDILKKLSINALSFTQQNYSEKIYINNLINVYKNIINKNEIR